MGGVAPAQGGAGGANKLQQQVQLESCVLDAPDPSKALMAAAAYLCKTCDAIFLPLQIIHLKCLHRNINMDRSCREHLKCQVQLMCLMNISFFCSSWIIWFLCCPSLAVKQGNSCQLAAPAPEFNVAHRQKQWPSPILAPTRLGNWNFICLTLRCIKMKFQTYFLIFHCIGNCRVCKM